MMKLVKWKILIITSIICLLPIFLGLVFWDELPEQMAIHFDINNNPDNWAPRGFTVFGIPALMAVFQVFCCISTDFNIKKHGDNVKITKLIKWIIPCITVALYIATLGYSLGWKIDIRRIAVFIVGVMLILTGNYLPKLDYIKNYKIDKEKARKINRFVGFETVIMGVLMLISIFLPPIASVICLILLIPYVLIGGVYGIKTVRK